MTVSTSKRQLPAKPHRVFSVGLTPPRTRADGRQTITSLLAGFSVGGAHWGYADLNSIKDPEERLAFRRRAGFEEAQMTARFGGNALRLFYNSEEISSGQSRSLVAGTIYPRNRPPAVYEQTVEERIQILDRTDEILDRLIAQIPRGLDYDGKALTYADLGAYIEGIADHNRACAENCHVYVLLTLVLSSPRYILEAPSNHSLHVAGRSYRFATLWDKFVHYQIDLHRRIVRDFVTQPAPQVDGVVRAFEIVNEPDYHWIPDEMRIERAQNPDAQPVGKYLTELHAPQIPHSDRINEPYQREPWGYGDQDAAWNEEMPSRKDILNFDWGRKFDWYVKAFAEFMQHLSYAVRDESRQRESKTKVISGGVTHNNIHYLISMYRMRPTCFDYVDAIAVHPYHWHQHDIWDDQYVRAEPTRGWRKASPRGFALNYMKRFDFLQELASLLREPDAEKSFGMGGKELWITEVGIPTKVVGKYNEPVKEFVKFIRRRGEPELADALPSVIWEDLWESFLSQVTRTWLESNQVQSIFLYSLREHGVAGFDKHDDDRSNFALLYRDGRPRLAAETFLSLTNYLSDLTRETEP